MSAPAWTPGPWEYRPHKYDDWGVIRARDGFYVAQCSVTRWSDEEREAHRAAKTDPTEANARLIAAAPCVVEAAVSLLASNDKTVAKIQGERDVSRIRIIAQQGADEFSDRLEDLRAALTKAGAA